MKTSSGKSKGRRCCIEVKELLHKHAPGLEQGDIMIPASSVPGADLYLSPAALKTYPFAIEAKNQEKIQIWAALEQSQSHAVNTPLTPLLFFKRNRSELFVSLKADDFFKLLDKKNA